MRRVNNHLHGDDDDDDDNSNGGGNKYFCIYCTFVTKKSVIFICTDAGSTCNVLLVVLH